MLRYWMPLSAGGPSIFISGGGWKWAGWWLGRMMEGCALGLASGEWNWPTMALSMTDHTVGSPSHPVRVFPSKSWVKLSWSLKSAGGAWGFGGVPGCGAGVGDCAIAERVRSRDKVIALVFIECPSQARVHVE